jgi:hypothetical protein
MPYRPPRPRILSRFDHRTPPKEFAFQVTVLPKAADLEFWRPTPDDKDEPFSSLLCMLMHSQ